MEISKHLLWSEAPRAVDSIFYGEIKRIIKTNEGLCGNEEPGIYIEGVEMHFLSDGKAIKSLKTTCNIPYITDYDTSGVVKVGAKVTIYTPWDYVGGTTEKGFSAEKSFLKIEFDGGTNNELK
ncbi:MAG TPA: hypothetical protein VFI61_00785 [Patescibacteria group bacterium]|nr:hypothetical protein [Patescibacteria group bacterium]